MKIEGINEFALSYLDRSGVAHHDAPDHWGTRRRGGGRAPARAEVTRAHPHAGHQTRHVHWRPDHIVADLRAAKTALVRAQHVIPRPSYLEEEILQCYQWTKNMNVS